MNLPPNEFTKKPRVAFSLTPEAKVNLESDDYQRAKPGDEVTSVLAFRASTATC